MIKFLRLLLNKFNKDKYSDYQSEMIKAESFSDCIEKSIKIRKKYNI